MAMWFDEQTKASDYAVKGFAKGFRLLPTAGLQCSASLKLDVRITHLAVFYVYCS